MKAFHRRFASAALCSLLACLLSSFAVAQSTTDLPIDNSIKPDPALSPDQTNPPPVRSPGYTKPAPSLAPEETNPSPVRSPDYIKPDPVLPPD